jgi:flagellar FliJ protein
MPRRFRFKLQQLEDVRRIAVTDLRARVADLRRRVSEAEQALKEMRADLQNLRDEMLAARARPNALTLTLPYEEFLDLLKRRESRLAVELAKRESALEKMRLELVEASRDLKVVEKVHERKLGEHFKEELKEEQKELDEQGTLYRQPAPAKPLP